jgi:ABC-type glycerol-3-phosphate transport system substrate-binding protein
MHTMMRKFSPVWLVISLALLAAQCTLPGRPAEPTPVTPVELTYFSFLDDASGSKAEQALIDQFEATHPHIKISRNPYARAPESYLTASPPPDLMVVLADHTTFSAMEQGLVLDLEEVWIRSNLADVYPTKFRVLGEYEGKSYFLPVAYTWTALYYDSSLFEQYDLTPPTTWDEFLAICDVLWLNGLTPVVLPRNDLWSVTMWFDYLNLRLNGPEFQADLSRGEIPYDDPGVMAVFEAWIDLIDKGCFGDTPAPPSVLRGLDAIIKGETGMILASPVQMQDLPETWRAELDFFRFPIMDPRIPAAEIAPTFGYLIPAGTLHPQEATEFLVYMSSLEAQSAVTQQFGSDLGVVPVHQGVDLAAFTPMTRQGLSLVRDTASIGQPYIFTLPESMADSASVAFRQFLLDPEKVDDAVSTLEKARQKAFGE